MNVFAIYFVKRATYFTKRANYKHQHLLINNSRTVPLCIPMFTTFNKRVFAYFDPFLDMAGNNED